MRALLLLITLILTNLAVAQEQIEIPICIVEKMPEFKGGEVERIEFLKKNIIYPEAANKGKMGGISYITFVVEKDGSITDVKVFRPNLECPSCDEEAVSVSKLMPNWIPGVQSGKEVRVQFNMPIKFTPKD